tara:strand:+ start:971 stop:1678 length:708 start_codon:yes stop_codon:yes gene_type:complete
MVRIDTVYQRVLAIANKEQRGYITPQEFNLFANQAQTDIFEQYFYDINQYGRAPKNSTEYSNLEDITDDKIAPFKKKQNAPVNLGPGLFDIPDYIYKLGTVKYQEKYIVDEVQEDELIHINNSPLAKPTKKRPVYLRFGHNITTAEVIQVYPTSISSGITYTYIKKPSTVNWGYAVVGGNALYDATRAVDFELHPSEEKKLVLKILALCGILLKEADLYSTATAEEATQTQQQKQ